MEGNTTGVCGCFGAQARHLFTINGITMEKYLDYYSNLYYPKQIKNSTTGVITEIQCVKYLPTGARCTSRWDKCFDPRQKCRGATTPRISS
jgi:hypothetical protein